MDIPAAFLTIILALLAAYFFTETNRLRLRIDRYKTQELKEQRDLFYDQSKRLEKLEEAGRKRLPYDKAAALEDAIAVKLEIERERCYIETRERQLMEILQMARGEDKYDVDRPSQRPPR